MQGKPTLKSLASRLFEELDVIQLVMGKDRKGHIPLLHLSIHLLQDEMGPEIKNNKK